MPDILTWVLMSAIVLLLIWLGISLRQNKQYKMQLTEATEQHQIAFTRTMDHLRHDWMNDVQVLYGYIQMNKQEKLKAYMKKIIEQIKIDGFIAKLGIPFLIVYLYHFRTTTNDLTLHVKLEQVISLAKYGDQGTCIAHVIIDFIEAYKNSSGHGEGEANKLFIHVHITDDQLIVAFEYDGVSDQRQLRSQSEHIIERIPARHDVQVKLIDSDQSIDIDVRARIAETTR